MSKKKVCIHCGKRNPEYLCTKCGREVCFNHIVFIDIGATLNLLSLLKLNKYKKHPSLYYCCGDDGTGCAKKKIEALLEA